MSRLKDRRFSRGEFLSPALGKAPVPGCTGKRMQAPFRLPGRGDPASPWGKDSQCVHQPLLQSTGEISDQGLLRCGRPRLDGYCNFPLVTTGLLLPDLSHSLLSDKCSRTDVVKLVAGRGGRPTFAGWRPILSAALGIHFWEVWPPTLAGPRAGGTRGGLLLRKERESVSQVCSLGGKSFRGVGPFLKKGI